MKISTKLFATGFVFFTVLLLEACDCQKTNTSQSSASDTLNLIKGSQYTVIDQSPWILVIARMSFQKTNWQELQCRNLPLPGLFTAGHTKKED